MKKSNKSKKDLFKSDKDIIDDFSKSGDRVSVSPNWVRILTLGFLISLVFAIIDIIIAISLITILELDPYAFLLSIMEYILFGEIGLIVFWGACLGNFGQSVFLSRIKERLVGGRPITKYSFREATFHSFTYYFAGGFILLYLLILHKIVTTLILLST